MTSFITRIELHNATYQDYQRLHLEMAGAGFQRVIRGDDGFFYDLPDAEYAKVGTYTIEQVHASAKLAAAKTGRTHGILVSEYVRARWSGLPRVNAKSA